LGNHSNVVTVDELANCVVSVTRSRSQKKYIDPTKVYGPHFVEANDKFPAAGRAIAELDWAPTYDVETVVRDAWSYMRAASPETFARLAGRKIIEQLVETRVGDVVDADGVSKSEVGETMPAQGPVEVS
jgi:hypothetical protein